MVELEREDLDLDFKGALSFNFRTAMVLAVAKVSFNSVDLSGEADEGRGLINNTS